MAGICDWFVMAGLGALILFAPLPLGSVHARASITIEGFSFLLGIVCIVRLLKSAAGIQLSYLWLTLPLGAFGLVIALILFQTIPLPFSILRVISPTAYQVYEMSLPGWPHQISYDQLKLTPPLIAARLSHETDPAVGFVSPLSSIRSDRLVQRERISKFARNPERNLAGPHQFLGLPRHRPISLSPSSTLSALWKLLAYTTVFFLVVAYPFDVQDLSRNPAARLARVLAILILISGVSIATIGIIQRFTWNGKILWTMVPDDWGAPRPGIFPRACGPFANPDHFANFLSMILPLALVAAFFPTSISSRARRIPTQMVGVFGVFTLCAAILLSLSRAGLVTAVLGIAAWCSLLALLPVGKRPFWLSTSHAGRMALVIPLGLALMTLVFVGPVGRNQADVRLDDSLKNSGLSVRDSLWIDSLKMARDFPLLGVGLGSWPEIFPRYQRPPYSKTFFVREPENDYVELLTEVGVFGTGLTAWILFGLAGTLRHSFQTVAPRYLPLLGALVAGIIAMTFHEFFDFSFHIPANALLAMMLLGMAVRLCLGNVEKFCTAAPTNRVGLMVAIFVLCTLIAGLFWVRPATYGLDDRASPADAVRLINAHPAQAYLHLSLVRLLGPALTPQQLSHELKAILWLEPTNPYARDLRASMLMQRGNVREGLEEITRAIYYSPDPSTHPYLAPQWVSYLLPREQKAIEDGYQNALNKKFNGAVDGLAQFYYMLSRFDEEAKLYQASAEKDPGQRLQYLLDAGIAYSHAGELRSAEMVLRRAIEEAPDDPRPYQYLVSDVFAPRKDLTAAKAVVSQGIDNGADEITLTLALAEAAGIAGNKTEQKAALAKALVLRPGSYDIAIRVASSYLSLGDCDQSARVLSNATELEPGSAEAFYLLGEAQEQCYQFANAEGSYQRAVNIEPSNPQFRRQLQIFMKRVGQSRFSSN